MHESYFPKTDAANFITTLAAVVEEVKRICIQPRKLKKGVRLLTDRIVIGNAEKKFLLQMNPLKKALILKLKYNRRLSSISTSYSTIL